MVCLDRKLRRDEIGRYKLPTGQIVQQPIAHQNRKKRKVSKVPHKWRS